MRNITLALALTTEILGILGSSYAAAQQPDPLGTPINSQSADAAAHDIAQDQLLNVKSRGLLSKYRAATNSGDRDRLSDELHKIIAAQFDIRQRMRVRELQRLADQLNRLRTIHQQRAEQKDRIVKDRIAQLLRDADGLGWGEVPHRPWPGVEVPVEFDQQPTTDPTYSPITLESR